MEKSRFNKLVCQIRDGIKKGCLNEHIVCEKLATLLGEPLDPELLLTPVENFLASQGILGKWSSRAANFFKRWGAAEGKTMLILDLIQMDEVKVMSWKAVGLTALYEIKRNLNRAKLQFGMTPQLNPELLELLKKRREELATSPPKL